MINLRTWTEERLYEARTISREGERLSSYWMGGKVVQIQRMRLHRALGAAAFFVSILLCLPSNTKTSAHLHGKQFAPRRAFPPSTYVDLSSMHVTPNIYARRFYDHAPGRRFPHTPPRLSLYSLTPLPTPRHSFPSIDVQHARVPQVLALMLWDHFPPSDPTKGKCHRKQPQDIRIYSRQPVSLF